MNELQDILTEAVNESKSFFEIYLERDQNDNIIPDKIEKAVMLLKDKGYAVKYSSPGYANTNFENDRNDDSVVNGKLVSTARVIFKGDYKFKTTPNGWAWKVLKDGSNSLYVKPLSYHDGQGSKKEAFQKWRDFYITSLESWAKDLPQQGEEKTPEEEDKHFASS